MKVDNYNFSTLSELESKLNLNNLDPKKTLIQIFSGLVLEDEIKKIQSIIKNKNKDIKFIGTTTAGEIFNGNVTNSNIIVSIVSFDETIVEYGSFENRGDFDLGVNIAKSMFKDDTKAVIVFLSGFTANGEDVVNGMSTSKTSVVISGAMAGDNGNFVNTYVFDNNSVYEKGGVVVALNSKVLNVLNDYQLNWQPFGKSMKVTKAEKNRLYEVDGITVGDLYKKYLGKNVYKRFPISATEFPLIKFSDGVQICRAITHLFDDGSVLTIGNLEVGDDVQFAVGNVDLIVNQTKENMQTVFKTKPEVIFNYSCAGRISFLQSNVNIELKPFYDIAPTVGFFSYGEIMHKNNKNFLLNFSLTFLGLSESVEKLDQKNKNKVEKKRNIFEDKHFIVIDALTHLSNAVIKELDESKAETEKAHRNIKDSIEFASLIQKAILPKGDVLRKYTKENFIIWQPKDVVGGDIYFTLDLENSDEFLLMVIDGAGHGVPGAFVTMLVKAIENQLRADLNAKKLDPSPAKILEYFNKNIKIMLNQNKGSKSNAGFDGGILYYNKTTKECKFAGAKTNLYLIQDNKLDIIKGDRKNVGFVRTKIDQKYTDHDVVLKDDTKLYITTDGIYDQEGSDGSRFGISRFEKLLLDINEYGFEKQSDIIKSNFNSFKQNKEQTDDVTIVGLCLK